MGTHTFMGMQGKSLSTAQIAFIVAPAFIIFGYNQAGLGGLITEDDWNKTFPEIDTTNTIGSTKSQHSTIQGVVVATLTLGAMVGALSCSYTGDKFGRRHVIFWAAVCSLIGSILEASSFSLAQFIVGRIVLGFGVGNLSACVPVWQSETSDAQNRGRHVVLDGLFCILGYVLESWIDLGFYEFKTGSVTWRPPIAISIFFSLVLMASIYFLPESPRWLVRMGRVSEARAAISAVRGLDDDSIEVTSELQGIEMSSEQTAKSAAKLTDMLRMGEDKLLYRFGLCIMLQFYQQLSGTNLVSVYTTILFQNNLGMGAEKSRILSAGALTWKFVAAFVAFYCIDRLGRRACFMISGAGMSACMVALAVATSFGAENRPAQITGGVFLYLFNFFVPIGFLGANYLYCTEVAPLRLRVAMSSISTANHWLWNFVVLMVTPVALDSIGWRYYIVFAVIGACIPISIYLFYPETMGRNLEELDLMFRESPSVWATVRFANKRPIAMPQEFSEAHNEEKLGVERRSSVEDEEGRLEKGGAVAG
ncbi:general substrate transporter [Phyllosticta citribraziliensis]|uniref:General substrate transporter n=1 Tax=Phyllosticta citribraziliensis TaxID=989973 RepID=A0ABR1L6L9_9PEZI